MQAVKACRAENDTEKNSADGTLKMVSKETPVLVVDDEPEVASLLQEFLEERECRVTTAGTGDQGRQALHRTPFDIVIMDLRLPDLDGITLMREALKIDLDPHPDVVLITGNATLDSAIAALDAGAAGYLCKPLDLDELVRLVDRLRERRMLRQENARLQAEQARRIWEMETLVTIGHILNSTVAAAPLLRDLARETARALRAELCVIHLAHEDDLAPAAAEYADGRSGADLWQRVKSQPPVEEVPVYAVAIGGQRAVVVGDCVNDAQVPSPWRAALDTRALLVVPLIRRREVMGVLALHDTRQPRHWDEHELKLATAIASEVALAIDNARVYDDVFTQQACLAQIFDSTSDAIVLVNEFGQIASANRRAGELLAFDPATIAGFGLLDVLGGHYPPGPAYERAAAPFQALLREPANGGHGDLELPRTRAIVQWTAQPTRNATGAVVGLTLTLHDVTREREISRMKSDFVSFVSHQLRTPLAGIKWLLELAARCALPEDAREYIEDSRSSAERLSRLVNELLDISRLESGTLVLKPEPTSLHEVTRSVLDDLRALVQDKGHHVHLRGVETLPSVVADPQLLRQVLLNLISNAIKYTPPAGEVSIRGHRAGGMMSWAIQDNGIGIPKSSQARLFEKFYRAENAMTIETEGTGLGLYLVRLIVEQWGGTITCDSDVGRGSIFTVTFPTSETRA